MLKEKLLQSIEALQEHSKDPESIMRLVNSIKRKMDFGDTPLDHWKTFYLIFLMYASWPDLKNNPKNKKLIALGKECVKNMKALLPSLNETVKSAENVKSKDAKQTTRQQPKSK